MMVFLSNIKRLNIIVIFFMPLAAVSMNEIKKEEQTTSSQAHESEQSKHDSDSQKLAQPLTTKKLSTQHIRFVKKSCVQHENIVSEKGNDFGIGAEKIDLCAIL
jgi:hypothetical protein